MPQFIASPEFPKRPRAFLLSKEAVLRKRSRVADNAGSIVSRLVTIAGGFGLTRPVAPQPDDAELRRTEQCARQRRRSSDRYLKSRSPRPVRIGDESGLCSSRFADLHKFRAPWRSEHSAPPRAAQASGVD